MSSSTVDPVSDALLATDSDATSTQPSSHPPPQSVLSRLYSSILRQLDFSRKTLLYLRLLAFFIIEVGYIILAAVCLVRPIPLKLPLTDAEVKGGFTTIFVVWQMLAIVIGGALAVDAFSREWSAQYEKLDPGTSGGPPAPLPDGIDRVSTITSGFLDRARHLLDDKSSGTFKLAFPASLLFLALHSLGPATINVAIALIDEPASIQIGRLFGDHYQYNPAELIWVVNRARRIVQLEKIEHLPFGFQLPPNMLAPVPNVTLTSFNGTIEYDSDVIEFHHDCRWEAPQILNVSGETAVAYGGQLWEGVKFGTGQGHVGSSIRMLNLVNISMMNEVSTSAFLFAGGNSSLLNRQSNSPVPFGIDLGSLPVTFAASGVGSDLDKSSIFAPLSSLLICDPQPQITGGRISVTNDGTIAVITSGKPPIGNIPRSAANRIFASALITAASIPGVKPPSTSFVTDIATSIFIPNPYAVNWTVAYGIRPLDLPSINKNMDAVMLSAAKAYIDGAINDESKLAVEFELDTVSATRQKEKLALMTSEWFFAATVGLVGAATVLLFEIGKSALAHERRPLDLKHIVDVFGQDGEGTALST